MSENYNFVMLPPSPEFALLTCMIACVVTVIHSYGSFCSSGLTNMRCVYHCRIIQVHYLKQSFEALTTPIFLLFLFLPFLDFNTVRIIWHMSWSH